MKRILRSLSIVSLVLPGVASVLLLTGGVAWAQLSTAQLTGKVTDPSGAVLPGATVTMTQTDTRATRSVVTDATGTYLLLNLPTGPYQLEVSLQGFRTYVQNGIVLQVAASPTINIVLPLGDVAETVTVEGAAPLVDVKSAGVSTVVTQDRIVELPLQGRQVTDLIVLAGSAVQTGQPPNHHFQGGANIAVAGGQMFGVAYVLDGAVHNDMQSSDGLPLPFPDALQEFRVATSGLSAQNGMRAGAEVNAVTKSGTNAFSGNLFEFYRDHRFNSINRFAPILPNGKQKDDGLLRHQFGGTLGGPVVRNKLFFFAGYQGTTTHQQANANVTFVPTAAMMAGDFTAITSPACNSGRQILLRGPFANNQINPAQFSPAAVKLTSYLPTPTNPCGEIRWNTGGPGGERNDQQIVTRVDYQCTSNHSLFGRYMATLQKQGIPHTTNVIEAQSNLNVGIDNLAESAAFGDTRVFGPEMVNAIRATYNHTNVDRYNLPAIEPKDIGINVYSYEPHRMNVNVTGAFVFGTNAGYGTTHTRTYQVSDDLTLVRGNHQLAMGANLAYWRTYIETCARCGGQWDFNGQVTGLGMADFLIGRLSNLEHGGPGGVGHHTRYLGVYAQDAWRASGRVTLNAGLRWEPYLGQQLAPPFGIADFSIENFRQGIKSSVFPNAPAGLIYGSWSGAPADAGFPSGRSGMKTQWRNLSPRLGVAWDINGDGRMALRSSYGIAYDFPVGDFLFLQTSAPPFGNRVSVPSPPGGFDNPYGAIPGGDPHPITGIPHVTSRNTLFPLGGAFGAITPDINSPRTQSWNVTFERQIGSQWSAAVSYLGSYSDRLWDLVPGNPARFMGLDPCTINGISYPVCSATANTNQRRALYLANPKEGQLIANLDIIDDINTSVYRGLKLSGERRSSNGLSLNGNYTWSYCFGVEMTPNQNQFGQGPTNPDDFKMENGNCSFNRTHIVNVTTGYETPRFASRSLRLVASDWRVSGILTASSGSWLNITTGRDNALNGQQPGKQRVNQVSDDVYGPKTLNQYLNPAAFAQPNPGTYGNFVRNGIRGPGQWVINLALSRLVALGGTRNVEFRVEAFNLFDHFNWGVPVTNFGAGNFGRITSQATDPRIFQFGIKYGF
jgi:hypothetical protein